MPKDGVRRRFYALLGERENKKLRLILDTDRFAAAQPILLKDDLSALRFTLESDNPTKHVTKLRLSGLAAGSYVLLEGTKTIAGLEIKDGQESIVEIPVPASDRTKAFTIRAAR